MLERIERARKLAESSDQHRGTDLKVGRRRRRPAACCAAGGAVTQPRELAPIPSSPTTPPLLQYILLDMDDTKALHDIMLRQKPTELQERQVRGTNRPTKTAVLQLAQPALLLCTVQRIDAGRP